MDDDSTDEWGSDTESEHLNDAQEQVQETKAWDDDSSEEELAGQDDNNNSDDEWDDDDDQNDHQHETIQDLVWNPSLIEEPFETEFVAHDHYYDPACGEKLSWRQSVEHLDNYMQDSGPSDLQKRKEIYATMYYQCKPIFETVGEDRHVNFVIDLDSMLIDIVESPQLDFSHGLQTLPCIHLIEKRLVTLRSGGRRPLVVEFDCMKTLWNDRPDILLLRHVVILHLQSLQEITLFRFPDFWCQKWLAFVGEWLPAFLIISAPGSKIIKASHHYIFEAMITYISICQDIPIVYSSSITTRSNALLGHKLEVPHASHTWCRKQFGGLRGMDSVPFPARTTDDLELNAELWETCEEIAETSEEQITIYTCALLLQSNGQKDYCALFCLARLLSDRLPLKYRRMVVHERPHARLVNFLKGLYPHMGSCMSVFDQAATELNNEYINPAITELSQKPILFLTDLVDGRLMHFLAAHKTNLDYANDVGLPADDLADLERIWDAVCTVSGVSIDLFPILERDEQKAQGVSAGDTRWALEDRDPLHCIELDTLLTKETFSDIDISLGENELIAPANPVGLSHFWTEIEQNDWQPGKVVKDIVSPHPQPQTVQEKRNAQNYLAFIEKYSKSLQPGKIVLRDVIVAQGGNNEKEATRPGQRKKGWKQGGKKNKKKGGGKKNKGKKKNDVRERARLEVEAKARAQKIEKTEKLINFLKSIHNASLAGLEERIRKLDIAFQSVADPESALPGLMQLREWCEMSALKTKQNIDGRNAIVRLWQVTHDIFRRFGSALNIEQIRGLQRSMLLMGYDESALAMAERYCMQHHANIDAVRVDPESVEAQIAAPPSYFRFQLEYGGHLMVRSVESQKDPRVKEFYPDAWQRELLDVVDSKGSALVVAPTSSGKTFVSWYAMTNTLQANKNIKSAKHKRRIVYVCPTKALVQQAAAEVYAKYGDVFGIFTQDYDHKILESEVTVVVPETFEILLTSTQREDYINSIDYVIFDEVHCLDSGDGGEIWERLFALVRCPFIALSATVGEPAIFKNWLTRIGKPFALSQAKGHYRDSIQLIHHHLRWSDLQKYIYAPSGQYRDPETGLTKFESGELHIQKHRENPAWRSACIDIHPAAAVSMANGLIHWKTGFPPNLNFSPKDSLRLYDSMIKEADRVLKETNDPVLLDSLKDLTPNKFFDAMVTTKKQAREWENALKDVIWNWVQRGESSMACAQKVLADLASKPNRAIQAMEDSHYERNQDPYTFEFVLENITQLLIDLEQQDRLPVLVFCLDRGQCMQILERIVKDLSDAEAAESQKHTRNVNADRDERRIEKEIKKIRKKIQSLEKKGKSKGEDQGSGTNRNDASEQIEALQEKLMALQGGEIQMEVIDERFTFMKNGETLEEDEMEYWKRRTTRRSAALQNGTSVLMRCLKHGIGIHHEGLSRQYKQFVETLFRAKHLKVVITTQTLAMGVNMPARAVVFAGEHPDLNPLAYRQMMGRAGRRGYDNIGHVTFLGIRPRKVAYLMTSQLTSLTGHYPVTPGICLKLSQQYESFLNKPRCLTALMNSMTPAFDKRVQIDITPQLRRHTRFTYEYLYHYGMMDEKGECTGLAGVASHLMRYEPANLVFVRLLESGIFHELTADYDSKNKNLQVAIAGRILAVLCHVFHDNICLPAETRPNAKSVLDPLEPHIQEELEILDRETFSLFEHYCRSMGDVAGCEEIKRDRERLPLSKVDFAKDEPQRADGGGMTLMKRIKPHNPQAVSVFNALSNPSDVFRSQREILERGRDDFQFFPKCITSSESFDARGRKLQKNAFALNWYKDEDYAGIIRNNYLRDGLAWSRLKRWQLLLVDIRHALRGISGLEFKLREAAMENRKKASEQEQDTYIEASHKWSIYKGARLLKDAYTNEVIKVLRRGQGKFDTQEAKETEDMIDALVQAFSFLSNDFTTKFKNIEHIKGDNED